MRVLVTGSRKWRDRERIHAAMLAQWDKAGRDEMALLHGAQRSFDPNTLEEYGADTLAAGVARELHWLIEEYPADWEQYGRAAGPIRNAQMVHAGPDVCLAFPTTGSRGTYDCMQHAYEAGVPVLVFTATSPAGGILWSPNHHQPQHHH